MATISPRRDVYFWVSWLTPLLSGDAHCEWAIWLKGHYKYDKLERGGFDLATWKTQHDAMLRARASELRADGWTVTIEDQNAFTLRGALATVAGKPDLVAVRGTDARVIDCKSGKRRDSDISQVLLYLLALPLAQPGLKDKRLVGELQYRDGSVEILPEHFTLDVRDRILETIKRLAGRTPAIRVPSARECAFCDIGPSDCPERVERAMADVLVPELF